MTIVNTNTKTGYEKYTYKEKQEPTLEDQSAHPTSGTDEMGGELVGSSSEQNGISTDGGIGTVNDTSQGGIAAEDEIGMGNKKDVQDYQEDIGLDDRILRE